MRSTGFSAAVLSLVTFATPGLAFFRMPCPGRILTERADPLISPGAVSGHVHTISGGNGFGFTMDYEQARASTCSSCPIKQDLSNYWTPSLYYQAQNGTFQYVPQSGDGIGHDGGMTVYYLQRPGPKNDKLHAFPEGFRMIAGDPFKRSATNDFAGQAVSFACINYSEGSPQTPYLPNKVCPQGLRAQVFFPSCWDGVNLDSADHKSHMAYPSSISYDNGPCPASHPVHMISLFYEVLYSTDGFEWWNGTQQPFVFAQGDPTGYGFHGDFVNGWDVDALQNATDRCTNASGSMTDCDVFDFFTNEESEACIVAPRVNEQVKGTLDALPGCNPVVWGPGAAPYGYAECPVANISTPQSYSTNVTGWDYVGCGADGSSRTLNGSSFSSKSMTVESCLSYCKSRGYHYAGLEYAEECYCGQSVAADRAPVDGVLGNCITPCAGNSSQYCGGGNRLSLYYSSTAATIVSCPDNNATTYTTNGTTFMLECGMDRSGEDLSMVYTSNGIQGCVDACGATPDCKAVALSGSACYMKKAIGGTRLSSNVQAARVYTSGSTSSSAVSSFTSKSSSSSASSTNAASSVASASTTPASSSVKTFSTSSSSSSSSSSSVKASSISSSSSIIRSITSSSSSSAPKTSSTTSTTRASSSTKVSSTSSAAATSATPLCPNLNATIYTEPITGFKFMIECGIDHSGGDLKMVYTSNLVGCISACANTTGCVDVTLSGTACYMKKSVGAPVYNGMKGAKLITSSSTSASATPTVATQQKVVPTSASTTTPKAISSSMTSSKASSISKLATVVKKQKSAAMVTATTK